MDVVGLDFDDADRSGGVDDDPWEEEGGEGIAIRTATLIVGGGELELSSVIEIFAEIERELSGDDETGTVEEELGFKNILARVSKEGGEVVVALVEAVRRFSSSSPLGIGIGMGSGGLERLGVEPV